MPVDAEAVNTLRRLAARLGRHFNATATAEGLTPTQASALGSIGRTGSVRIAELVRLEHVHPSAASRAVARLEASGLIRRRVDADDQRSAWVEITPSGRRMLQRIADLRAKVVADAAAGLSSKDAAAIERALPALEVFIARLDESRDGSSG